MKDRLKKLFTNVWNIPNALTMLRLALIPVFVILFWNGHRKMALVVFVVASLTDMLDGMLARKLNQITDFGKLFDPLADKLMVLTALVCQGLAGVFPWSAILIVGLKELVMLLCYKSLKQGMLFLFLLVIKSKQKQVKQQLIH